jgi:hypothetical protein
MGAESGGAGAEAGRGAERGRRGTAARCPRRAVTGSGPSTASSSSDEGSEQRAACGG